MSIPKIVVHTDVILEHLAGSRRPSILRRTMGRFFCYTTVFQAVELFALAGSEKEFRTIEDALAAMKVLGLNQKHAPRYGRLLVRHPQLDRWNLLIAGLCIESRLPLLTDRSDDFRGIAGLQIVPTRTIERNDTRSTALRKS